VALDGQVLMVGAPWDTMTPHHADHLADLPNKLVRRFEVPLAENTEKIWQFVEEFDTTEPIVEGLPENYIEQIVTAYVAGGAGRQVILALPSSSVDACRYCLSRSTGRKADQARIARRRLAPITYDAPDGSRMAQICIVMDINPRSGTTGQFRNGIRHRFDANGPIA
jgi:hypothetical protein